jgi:hypothetical protein
VAGQLEVIVLPYRDLYFAKRYGWGVRDLAILKALSKSTMVSSLIVIQRPITIYERILGKVQRNREGLSDALVVDKTSFDIFGPRTGRSWTRHAYANIGAALKALRHEAGGSRIILDFTPMAAVRRMGIQADYYWYDVIDNFVKHNRYSPVDRRLVQYKYQEVAACADLITGVTAKALSVFPRGKSMLVANGIGVVTADKLSAPENDAYDFGFLGYLTDKFDVHLVRVLAEGAGKSVVIYGKSFDRAVGEQLKRIPNVRIGEEFSESDIPTLMRTFRIGIIPYLAGKSHDGSPLKLYLYLAYGRQVLSTMEFPGETTMFSEYVKIIEACKPESVHQEADRMLKRARSEGGELVRSIASAVGQRHTWDFKVKAILERITTSQNWGESRIARIGCR